MSITDHLHPKDVFKYFEEISSVPRGSGNRDGISAYCMKFAADHSLKAICDDAKNVIIYKGGTNGYEAAPPVILQGHLDMVCQKNEDSDIDFEKDGIRLMIDGDTISADGTTLGADNGIAVAMIMAILASDDIPHPPIEAVFTVDEEIGMLGAVDLDTSVLKGRLMINIDSEEEDCMTVSCAGGSDFRAALPINRIQAYGTQLTVSLKGLRGGHSGICINEGRVNSNILAGRFLKALEKAAQFDIVSICGGDKANAITLASEIVLCSADAKACAESAGNILSALTDELATREPDFAYDISGGATATYDVLDDNSKKSLIHALVCTPNGVIDMSADIENLVETSLNLGILQTYDNHIDFSYALRSNKKTALRYLEDRMSEFFGILNADVYVSGQYPPWEFKKDSPLQNIYINAYRNAFGRDVRVEAIHAGLECAVFSDKIPGLDCIAIGPFVVGAHTTSERLSVSSVERIYSLLKDVLSLCK